MEVTSLIKQLFRQESLTHYIFLKGEPVYLQAKVQMNETG